MTLPGDLMTKKWCYKKITLQHSECGMGKSGLMTSRWVAADIFVW